MCSIIKNTSLYYLSFLIIAALSFTACKEKEGIGIPVNNPINVFYLDTFSVDLSTVYLDSLPTSTSDKLLSGKLDLGSTGSLTTSSYFQMSLKGNDTDGDGMENILEYTGTPVYDSLVLILEKIYSYGNDDAPHTLSVHRVNQSINYHSGSSYLFNGSFFSYDVSALGSKSFVFNDNTTELKIRIDGLGNDLFNLAKVNDYRVATTAAFKDYLKGLVLISGSSNESVYGYNLNPVMRMYYHDSESPQTQKTYDFTYNSSSDIRFNRITNDRSGTAINSLQELYQEINSSQTNNESYLLTGIELMPKIKFPTLKNLKAQFPLMVVNAAYLIIHPKENTYSEKFYLPERLVLYTTNNTNKPDTIVSYYNSSTAQVISPQVDYESANLTHYTFNVTDYAIKQLESESYNDAGLILAPIQSESGNRTERLVLENNHNNKYRVKLKLYVTNLNP